MTENTADICDQTSAPVRLLHEASFHYMTMFTDDFH